MLDAARMLRARSLTLWRARLCIRPVPDVVAVDDRALGRHARLAGAHVDWVTLLPIVSRMYWQSSRPRGRSPSPRR